MLILFHQKMYQAGGNAKCSSVAAKMQRRKLASSGLPVIHNFPRGRKLVGLIPRVNAISDIDSSSSDEEEISQLRRNSTSPDAPTINSSLERLNLLGEDSDKDIDTN
ncbi:uncharacterized protein [Choristoneura fumiferana]|uniref:uncharacterized protein n=1 Tax=Choristoneura fumiferana TaxID=7141 RepID=UPI003D15B57E